MRKSLLLEAVSLFLHGKATSVPPDCIYDGRYFSGAAGDHEDLRSHCQGSLSVLGGFYGGEVSVAFTASMDRVGSASSWDKLFDHSVNLGSMFFLAVSPDQHLNFQQYQQSQWRACNVFVPLFEKRRYLITMSASGYMKLWRDGVLEGQTQGFPLEYVEERHLRISSDEWGKGEFQGTVEDFWLWHSEVGWESANIERTSTTTTAVWVAPFFTYEGRRFTGASGDYEDLGSHTFGGELSVAFTASMERLGSQSSWDKLFDFSVANMNNMLYLAFGPDQHLWFQMYQSGQWKICKLWAALNEKRRYLVTISASGYMRFWRDGVLEAQAQGFPLAQGLRKRWISYDTWNAGWLQGTVEDLWIWHSLVGWESAIRTTTTTLVASTTTSRTWTSTTSLTGTSMTATSTVTSSTASSVTSTTETVTSTTVSSSTSTLTGTSTSVTSTTSSTISSTQTGTTLTVTTTTVSTSTGTVTGTSTTVSVTTSSTSSTSLTGTSVTVTTSTSSTTSSTLTRTSMTVTSSTTSTRSSTLTVTSTTTATGSSTSSVSSVTATGTTTLASPSTSTFSNAGLTSTTVTHTSAEGESLSSTSPHTRSVTTVTVPLLSQRVAKIAETTNVPEEEDGHAPRKDLEVHTGASSEVTSTTALTSASSAKGATAMVTTTSALTSASSAVGTTTSALTSASSAMGAAGLVQGPLDFVVIEIHLMGVAAAINMSDFVEQLTAAMPATLQLPSGDLIATRRSSLGSPVFLEVATAVQPAPEAAALSERLARAADDVSAALTLQLGGAAEIKAVRLGSQGLAAAASSGGARARAWEGALLEVVEKGAKALLQQLQESNSTMLGTTVAGLITVATRLDAPSGGGENGEEPDFIRVPLGLPQQKANLEVKLPTALLASLRQRPNVSELALVASMPSLQAAQDAAVELAAWLSIEIFELQGQRLEVSTAHPACPSLGLETAIEFTMAAGFKPGLGCAFWDEAQQRWSHEGVALGEGNVFGEPIVCKTEHLSLFGAVLTGFIETYVCSQPALMTMDALFEVFRADWLSSPGAILYWCLLVVLVTGFAMSVAIDHLRDGWMMWSDEFFLVPLHSSPVAQSQDVEEEVQRTEDDWSAKKVGYVLSSIAACLTCAMYCFRGAAAFCKETALRDALDEIVSEYVEYFSEVRVVLEGLFADIAEVLLRGAETEALAAGRFGHVRQLMAQHMVLATARRLVGASMGLNGEVVEFVLDDKELLELLQKMAHYETADADHHPALGADPMRSVGSDASEEELAVVQPVAPSTSHTSPGQQKELLDQVLRLCEEGQDTVWGQPGSSQVAQHARRQQSRVAGPGSSKRRRSAFANLAKGTGTRRMLHSSYAEGYSRFSRVEFAASPWHGCDTREDAWAALHDEILDHLTSHVAEHSWFSVPRMVRALFLVLNPLGGICTRSIFGSCRMRAFFHALELTGDLLVICIFHSGSVRGRSRGNTGLGSAGCGDDELSEAILYKVGRVVAIATAAIFIACLPVSFLKTLRTRHFKWLPWEGCDEWQKQLKVWEIRDQLVWVFGSFYFFASHCLIVVFLANIAPEDHEEWTTTGTISLLQDAVLFPLGTAILMPTIAAIMLSGASTAAQARRTRLIHRVNVRVHGGAPMQAIVSAI